MDCRRAHLTDFDDGQIEQWRANGVAWSRDGCPTDATAERYLHAGEWATSACTHHIEPPACDLAHLFDIEPGSMMIGVMPQGPDDDGR